MKKFTKLISVLISATLLASCSTKTQPDQNKSETSESITSESKKGENTTEPLEETATTNDISTEKQIAQEEFNIHDYFTDFDSATPMKYWKCGGFNIHKLDLNIMEIAISALKESEYYKSVITEAKQILVYENGKHQAISETWTIETYLEYFNKDDASEFEFQPVLVNNFTTNFDGKNEGFIFIFEIPLPPTDVEWSGASTFYVPVFVNNDGKAFILEEAAQQTLYSANVITYSDGISHMLFDSGHTTGTQQSFIYSFNNGVPKLELENYCITSQNDDYMLYRDSPDSSYWYLLFFRDAERDCYCAISEVAATDEFAEYIHNNPIIIEKYANEIDNFDEAEITIFGGKYISIGNYSFEFDGEKITECGRIVPPDQDEFKYTLNYDLTQLDEKENTYY